ncbi:hypothetical protein E4T81_04925 [Barnesiella sp. WM24]|uniref:hypothetical protein n=1 Tax=Barnesiella sp. WM24 TaxID=2558278 RepID=UPI00107255A2|nr:hypothetical protein [Barnesiella sp. WM24]TFU93938.1 hypothetical protein E4T81_04925 [Barnesiella sp. WM24]
MYNPQRVIDLLNERGLKKKQLISFMKYNEKVGLTQAISGDVRASKLEKMADFLGVPIDAFFDRTVQTEPNQTPAYSGVDDGNALMVIHEREKNLRSLLEEKDKRIAVLEDLVAMLKGSGEKSSK